MNINSANPAPVSAGSALISTDHTCRRKWLQRQRQGVLRVQDVPRLLRQLGAHGVHVKLTLQLASIEEAFDGVAAYSTEAHILARGLRHAIDEVQLVLWMHE